MATIPLLDYKLLLKEFKEDTNEEKAAIRQLHDALSTIGFVYFTNCGISDDEIDAAFQTSKDFFDLPLDTKLSYLRKSNDENAGYVQMEMESLDPKRPGDLKECFNIHSCSSASVPASFKDSVKNLYDKSLEVAMNILEAMGHALRLEDPKFFVKAHAEAGQGSNNNVTTMRLLYYPPLTQCDIKPGQVRCGEHVDYGSITLLYQGKDGGLQVRSVDGSYIDAPCVPGAVLVNLGALMQKWTADKYQATPHRVLLPTDEELRSRVRQSIVFFVQPDNDIVISCIDGSNKYPPITSAEDIAQRFAKTYK